jgi:hypothetical protein
MSLKNAAGEASVALHAHLGPARTLADELSLMIAAGERVAARIEAGRNASAAPSQTPAPRIIRNGAQAGDNLRVMR